MRYLLLVVFIASIAPALRGQEECSFGGDKAFNDLTTALEKAASCRAAIDKLHACAWGSSADAQFAPIAISKCEKTFLAKLPPPAEERYIDEMQLCAYRESRAEGTIHISEAALCQGDVAADYATHPEKRNDQPLRASFNCASASTPLEMATCSHIALGHADIVLSRSYADVLRNIPARNRAALIRNETQWLAMVPRKCEITTSTASDRSVNCARNEFELRFTVLDDCQPMEANDQNYILPCIVDSSKSWTQPPDLSPRASFDCEKPTNGVELAICADSDLGQLDLKLDAIYHDALNRLPESEQKPLVDTQQRWHRFVTSTCPLGAVGGIPHVITRGCIQMLYEKRVTQLEICSREANSRVIPCLNTFEGVDAGTR